MGVASTVLSGIGIGGSIASSGLNYKAQQDANKTNMEIAQMNNEFNAAEALKNREFQSQMYDKSVENQWKMFDATNEFNSASNQRKRLEEAGINPSIAMSGSNAGSASAVGGTTSPSGAQASSSGLPQISAPMFDMGGIRDALSSAIELDNVVKANKAKTSYLNAQANQINVESQYTADKLLSEIQKNYADSKSQTEKGLLLNKQNAVFMKQFAQDFDLKAQSIENMKQTYRGLIISNALQSKELNSFDDVMKLRLAQMSADISLQISRKQLSENQAKHELVKMIKTEAEKRGLDMSNFVANKTAFQLIEQAKWTTEQIRNNSGPSNFFQNMHGSGRSLDEYWKQLFGD